jgi:hypothetical protein
LQTDCKVIADRLQGYCRQIARLLQTDCKVIADRLQTGIKKHKTIVLFKLFFYCRLEYGWNVLGIWLECSWNMAGMFLEYGWNVLGIWLE